ncbi:hypothetical protein [Hyphobacterium marinum]|uniref:Uncharacterized protein n=1 Tax=Hyphobacterium marinum TaxID=3116574 RepID=A0ABU7LUK9_9PROT|nr:hypothetical protein [Hyphobacterium sp. Y6023]MEE2565238.1 hypothetical protein [Hyphobacterium sp. Y6023]
MIRRRRYRHGAASNEAASATKAPDRAREITQGTGRTGFYNDAPKALFQDDLAAQRLFNRAALEEMGDYGAVILASDSLRPAWSEPGDLVHVRRGAEDARAITRKVSGKGLKD